MDQIQNEEQKYPVDVVVAYPEHSSRLLAFLTLLLMLPKMIVLIPHFVVLYILGIASFIAFVFGQIAVLFTGRYPRSLFDFVVGVARWQVRTNAYFTGLTDKYPPFALK